MPQRPKREVREAILEAAGEAFATAGFGRAALADIAERAGTSVGNLYKYFANKDELFAAFLPHSFPMQLAQRVQAQVEALRGETDAFELPAEHPYFQASESLLRFAIDHRDRVVFLLLRADGTAHDGFRRELIGLLVDLASQHAERTYPAFAGSPHHTRALTRIYGAFVATIGLILVEEKDERSVRRAIALETTYHLSGLKALFVDTRRPATAEGS